MDPPNRDTDELIKALGSVAGDDLLSRATILYVSALPDELRTFVHCGAILRWFDRGVLEAVLESKELVNVGRSVRSDAVGMAYQQLQKLTFVERYPGRGYTFHELTRASLRGDLWTLDRDFYRAVSKAAFNYFARRFEEQKSAYEAGRITRDQVDMGLPVEMLYHCALAQDSEYLSGLEEFMYSLYADRDLGPYHDMIVALDDHIEGGRLEGRLLSFVSLWKAREAFANWEFDLLLNYALPLADSHAQAVPVEVSAEASQLLGLDADRRAQYEGARRFFERSRARWESLENSAGVVQALIGLSGVSLSCEDYSACRRYVDEALQHWGDANRVPASDESEIGSIPPLSFRAPMMWDRHELEVTSEGDNSEESGRANGTSPCEQPEEPDQRFVLYFVPVDDGSGDRAPNQVRPMWPVQVDGAIAEIWLIAALLAEQMEDYDQAAACARLSGMIYVDIGDLAGAHGAVSVLERIGARKLDHELLAHLRDYRRTITATAAGGGDKRTLFPALVGEAESLHERLQLNEARAKWAEALSVAIELRLDNGKATCLQGLAGLEWSHGNIAKAREFFESAIEAYQGLKNQEGLASTLVRRSELEVSQRQFLDAKRYAQQALATYRDLGSVLGQFDAFHVMAAILRQEGEYNEAFALYHKALDIARLHKRTSLTAISLSRIADLELALGRKMDAEFNYDEAISIARRSRQYLVESQILLDKARVLLEQAEYAEANGILDRVLEANSEDQAAWSLKGWCLEQFGPGKADEAVDANKRAIESTPGDIWRHKNLASALELQGRNEEAEAKRRWIIETFGVNPMVSDLSALGWCYYKLGELERAAKVFGEFDCLVFRHGV